MINNMQKNIKKTDKFCIQPYRFWIQIGFSILTIWVGIEFYVFVTQLEQGINPTVSRPPGVEAFLPISALISFKYWLFTGIYNTIHPSALVLLSIFVLITLILKKGFCSWICPFGLLSDILNKLHRLIFDRQLRLPRWLDYPLRSLKYLVLLFFVYAVFVQMNLMDLKNFIYSPYNRVADIKMLYFFTKMSDTTLWILVLLVGLSLAIPYFWCRFLCPYGALLGAMSWLSPFKIHRNTISCIDCEKCSKVCPAGVKVHKDVTVFSDECHACLHCVDICPVKDTLYLSLTKNRFRVSRKAYAFAIVLIFIVGTSIARLLGIWQNGISHEEYLYHIKNINSFEYHHNRGQVSEYDKEKWQPHSNENKSGFSKNLKE
jgi:polyferredoxin